MQNENTKVLNVENQKNSQRKSQIALPVTFLSKKYTSKNTSKSGLEHFLQNENTWVLNV